MFIRCILLMIPSAAYAALPESLMNSLVVMGADTVTISTIVLVIIVGIAAIALISKGLD